METDNVTCAVDPESEKDVNGQQTCWYAMRDLKRPNTKRPAYKMLQDKHFEVFTPMKWITTVTRQGKHVRQEIPFMQDLLFVHSTQAALDKIVNATDTLQYRYIRGAYCKPIIINDTEMNRFISIALSTDAPVFYTPEELTSSMCGRKIRIIGGLLDNYEGSLLSIRGSKKRYLLVKIKGLLAVGVEVNPEYIQFI